MKGCLLHAEPRKQRSCFLSDVNIRLPCEQDEKNKKKITCASQEEQSKGRWVPGGGHAGTRPLLASSAKFSPVSIQGEIHPKPSLNDWEWLPRGLWAALLDGWTLASSLTHPRKAVWLIVTSSCKATVSLQDSAGPEAEQQALMPGEARNKTCVGTSLACYRYRIAGAL